MSSSVQEHHRFVASSLNKPGRQRERRRRRANEFGGRGLLATSGIGGVVAQRHTAMPWSRFRGPPLPGPVLETVAAWRRAAYTLDDLAHCGRPRICRLVAGVTTRPANNRLQYAQRERYPTTALRNSPKIACNRRADIDGRRTKRRRANAILTRRTTGALATERPAQHPFPTRRDAARERELAARRESNARRSHAEKSSLSRQCTNTQEMCKVVLSNFGDALARHVPRCGAPTEHREDLGPPPLKSTFQLHGPCQEVALQRPELRPSQPPEHETENSAGYATTTQIRSHEVAQTCAYTSVGALARNEKWMGGPNIT